MSVVVFVENGNGQSRADIVNVSEMDHNKVIQSFYAQVEKGNIEFPLPVVKEHSRAA